MIEYDFFIKNVSKSCSFYFFLYNFSIYLLQDRGQQLYDVSAKEVEKLQSDLRYQEHKMQEEREAHELEMRVCIFNLFLEQLNFLMLCYQQLEMTLKHHQSFHETELEKVDTENGIEREKNGELHEERFI